MGANEKMVTLSLTVPESFVSTLDALSSKFQDPPRPSIFTWMSTYANGRKFIANLNQPGHPFRSLSQAELNRTQRDLYRKDCKVRCGPRRKREARVKVLQLALDAYRLAQGD